MNRIIFLALAALLVHVGHAEAQDANPYVEGAGVRVGEGTVLHPILGLESGVVQNVFYEENDTKASGILRILGQISVGSLPAERMQMPQETDPDTKNFGDLAFRGDAALMYEQYLSGNDRVLNQGGLSADLMAQGIVFPKQTWQFAFRDEFIRSIRPTNFESDSNLRRDVNHLNLDLRFRPIGRTIHWSLGYSNRIDHFEDSRQQFADRILHRGHFRLTYQWLPITQLYGDVSLGYSGPLGDASTRPTSYPLKAYAGIATALTVKTNLNARVGFGKGFYSDTDFTNIVGRVQLSYRPSPEVRLSGMYEYDFEDSINANFYRDHAIAFRADYRRNRLTINGMTELRFRAYRQVIAEVMSAERDRNDVIFAVGAGMIYNFKNWIAATLDYNLTLDQTDFRYMADATTLDDPSFVRQVVLLGVRAAY